MIPDPDRPATFAEALLAALLGVVAGVVAGAAWALWTGGLP